MLTLRTVCGILCLVITVADAQSEKEPNEPAKFSAGEPAQDADVQQRRASLRATLKSQMELVTKREGPAGSERQLSVQERADLRQQLRHQ